MAAKKNELQKLLDLAGEFVTNQNGVWEHNDWENFLKKADKIGAAVDDEGKRNLGNILEASKFLYLKVGITPSKPKSKAKSPAKKKPAKKKATTKKSAKKD